MCCMKLLQDISVRQLLQQGNIHYKTQTAAIYFAKMYFVVVGGKERRLDPNIIRFIQPITV